MGWLPTRPSLRPTTAAAATGQTPSQGSAGTVASDGDVWRLWRTLGELHYSTTFMARQVGRLAWRVTIGGSEVSPDDAASMIGSVTAPGRPATVTAAMALHMQVAGQFRYVHTDADGWQVLSAGRTARVDPERDRAATVDLRTIRRDPADPDRADSPVKAAAPLARELALLSALSRSQARNRTAQRGLLLYPQEQQWADGFNFADMIQRVMTAPLANEHDASAVVPPTVPTPSELIDKWRLLTLDTGWDDDLPARIEAVTRRLALALDHPPEILLGIGDVNHWSAWQVSEDTYRAHVEPLADWVAGTLAAAISKAGDLDPDAVVVTPDPAELLRRLPTVADTLTAYTLGLVSDEFTRSVLGATEDDAGTGIPVTTGPPAGADQPGVDGNPGPPPVAAAADGPPDPDGLGEILHRIDVGLLETGRTAADAAISRARERIGAKVRTAVRSDRDGTAAIDGVDNADVAATLGVDVAARHVNIHAVAADVVTDALADWWTGRLQAAADQVEQAAGITLPDLTDQTAASVALLTGLVTDRAVAGLADTEARRGAPPTGAVRRAIDVAGGNGDPAATAAADVAPPTLGTTGFARGAVALEAIRVQTGMTAQRWRWLYGDPADRQAPHPGHRRLSGTLVSNDGYARTHDPGTGDTWMAYPGDHAGCQCDLVPAFTKER